MANLPNLIVTDVADLQESEIHKITKKLEETQNEKEMLKRENEVLKLMNQQLTTQLTEKTKQLDSKEKEVQQLRRELQASNEGSVLAERKQAEFNAFSGLDSVNVLKLLVNCNCSL